MEKKNDYRISFFKPTTALSRTNRNLVILLVIIWAVAIFGFQILLRVMQKPVPESSMKTFEKVWSNIEQGIATQEEKVDFTNSVLSVLGKSVLISDPASRLVLINAVSSTIYGLIPEEAKETFLTEVANFEKKKENIQSLQDNDYLKAKANIINRLAPLLNLEPYSLKAKLLPLVISASEMEIFKPDNKEKLPDIMKLYLVHNRSILTDTNFLGFPFHYFYTAIFLLIMFVVLCWIYCFLIDRVHSKLGTDEKS
ncbi:MAG: DUF4212 domain-containing protein [Armatimonadetes bacterium]|nr:DUF4212 domain-containing protein [Armatimonadota bacterium]